MQATLALSATLRCKTICTWVIKEGRTATDRPVKVLSTRWKAPLWTHSKPALLRVMFTLLLSSRYFLYERQLNQVVIKADLLGSNIIPDREICPEFFFNTE